MLKSLGVTMFACLMVCGLIAGCGKPAPTEHYTDNKLSSHLEVLPAAREDATVRNAVAVGVPQLAYDYVYGFTAPEKGAEALLKADQTRCTSAGLQACQMISFSSQSDPQMGGGMKTRELRVSPEWLKAYQASLDQGLKAAQARISTQSVTSEDLSLEIVDTEARLANKLALRDRLQQVIRSGSGKVADLVEAEIQLAQVQGDIDASRSALAVMQKRVATVHLTLTYTVEPKTVSDGTFSPVVEALTGVIDNLMKSLGALITLISYLLPFVLVLGAGLWVAIKRFGLKWPDHSKPKPEMKPETKPEPETPND